MQTLTTEEAIQLIDMLKKYIEKKRFDFPDPGKRIQFSVIGDTKADKFSVNIYRQRINSNGITFQGRTESDNIILMRLDVNPTSAHLNPDGEKIVGTHLHVYKENYGEKFAIPFDVNNKDLFEICFTFFKKFNIINGEEIINAQYSINL